MSVPCSTATTTRALVDVDAASTSYTDTPGLPAVLVSDRAATVALTAPRRAALLLWARDLVAALEPVVDYSELIEEQHRRAHATGATWCPTCRITAVGGARSSCGGLLHSVCDTLLTTAPGQVPA